MKNFVKASMRAIPPLVSVSVLEIIFLDRIGTERTTASVLEARGALKIA